MVWELVWLIIEILRGKDGSFKQMVFKLRAPGRTTVIFSLFYSGVRFTPKPNFIRNKIHQIKIKEEFLKLPIC